MYFLYNLNLLFQVNFNLKSNYIKLIFYKKPKSLFNIKQKRLNSLLSEVNYTFKTKIGKEEQSHISQKMIHGIRVNAMIAYLVAKKFY